MEKLKQMKECLTGIVEGQVYGNLDKVDAKELGEAVDMIKDLAEAIYYCTITEAMEEGAKENGEQKKHGMMYYAPSAAQPMYRMPHQYPIEYYDPRYRERTSTDSMYAQRDGGGDNSSSSTGGRGGSSRGYREGMMPTEWRPIYDDGMMRDPREGRSGKYRKMYMDGKGMKDKSHQMRELEEYIQELGQDLAEMVQDASSEEKALLQQKISTLANKIK